jgi:hypothetical protein
MVKRKRREQFEDVLWKVVMAKVYEVCVLALQ